MAIGPWQHSALPSELARAIATALAADHLMIRTPPLRDGPSTYLQSQLYQLGLPPNCYNYDCRYIDGPSRRGGVWIIKWSAAKAVASARTYSAGHAECCQGFVAIRLPSRKYGGACRAVQGSAAAYPTMEDIGLPRGCARGLGHGENAVYQAGSKSHGPGRTARVKWGRNSH